MNEIQFQSRIRELPDGTVVLLYREAAAAGHAAGDGLHAAAAKADAVGMLLTFIDPAKPLVVYRSAEPGICVDFLQDAVYCAETGSATGSCLFSIAPAELPDISRVWDHISALTGHQLATRNQQYLAYAEGMLGKTCSHETANGHPPAPTDFLAALCSWAGIDYDGLSIGAVLTNLQEDRYVYPFA